MTTAMEELSQIIDQAILEIQASNDPFPEAKQKEVKALLEKIKSGGRITDNSAYDLMYKLGFNLYTKNRSHLDSKSKQSFVLFREIFEAFYKKVDHPKTKAAICFYIASICDAYNQSVDNSRNAVAKYQEILGLIDQDVARDSFNQTDPDIVINAGMFGAKLSNNDIVADRVLSAKGLIEKSINGCYINILNSGDINKLPSEIIEEALSFFNGIKFQGIQRYINGSVNDNNIQFKQGSLLLAERKGIKRLRIFRNQIEGLVGQIESDELDKKALKGEIRAELQKSKSGDKNELKRRIKEKIKQIKLEEEKRKGSLNAEINSTFALTKDLILSSLNQNPLNPEDLIQSILILKTLSDTKNVDKQTKKLALQYLSQIKEKIDLSCLLKDQLQHTARSDALKLCLIFDFLSEKGFSEINQTAINNFAFDGARPRLGLKEKWDNWKSGQGPLGEREQLKEALNTKLKNVLKKILPPPIPTSTPKNAFGKKFEKLKLKYDLSSSPTLLRSNKEFNLVNKELGEGEEFKTEDPFRKTFKSLQHKGNNLNAKVHEGTPGERIKKKEFASPEFFYGKGILLEKGTLPYIDNGRWCIKVGEVVEGSHPHKLRLAEGDIISVSGIALEDNNKNKEQVLIAMRNNNGFDVVESKVCSKGFHKVNNVMLDNSGDKLKIRTFLEKEIGAEKLNSSNLGGRSN